MEKSFHHEISVVLEGMKSVRVQFIFISRLVMTDDNDCRIILR